MYKILCEPKFSFLRDARLGRWLQDHTVSICLIFKKWQLGQINRHIWEVQAPSARGQRCPLSPGRAQVGKEPILIALQRLRLQVTQQEMAKSNWKEELSGLQSYPKQSRENSETNFKQQNNSGLQQAPKHARKMGCPEWFSSHSCVLVSQSPAQSEELTCSLRSCIVFQPQPFPRLCLPRPERLPSGRHQTIQSLPRQAFVEALLCVQHCVRLLIQPKETSRWSPFGEKVEGCPKVP